jgi:hypothetical protein
LNGLLSALGVAVLFTTEAIGLGSAAGLLLGLAAAAIVAYGWSRLRPQPS